MSVRGVLYEKDLRRTFKKVHLLEKESGLIKLYV